MCFCANMGLHLWIVASSHVTQFVWNVVFECIFSFEGTSFRNHSDDQQKKRQINQNICIFGTKPGFILLFQCLELIFFYFIFLTSADRKQVCSATLHQSALFTVSSL